MNNDNHHKFFYNFNNHFNSMNGNLSNSKIPRILYKYRNFNPDEKGVTHLDHLINGTIYLSNPDTFNDPFDCQTPINYMEFKDNNTSVLKFIETQKNKLPKNIAWKVNPDALSKNSDFLKAAMNDDIKELNSVLGVYCLSKIQNSILMWAHYANSHSGFCFGIDTKILQAISQNLGVEKVKYEKKYPLISPNDSIENIIAKQVLYKSDNWKYEKEYRLIGMEIQRLYKIPNTAIKSIYLGVNIDPKNEENILNLKSTIFSHCSFYKMKKSDNKFELIYELI